jgi:hypothetical protein
MTKISLILILAIATISCQSEKDKQLNEKSQLVFEKSVEKIKKSFYVVNVDSFRVVYEKHKSENPQTALDFANRFDDYSTKLLEKREEIELAENILEAKRRQRETEKNAENRKVWENSKYGKLQKKHPDWTDDECMKVVDKKIWIGMTYDMLLYQRGKPNTVNPSNYGSGTQYQCCWDDYSPSCFYMKEDNIIYSYN